jgi:SAM-dependent methyltransferase
MKSLKSRITDWTSRLIRKEIARSTELVDELGRPNINPIWIRTRNEPIISRNIKNFGYQMARQLAAQRANTPGELMNLPVKSKATRQADVESSWFAYWCAQLGIPVTYHRKIWEYCFLLQTLHDEKLLLPGRNGLGFACGQEPIPSYLASRGIFVTATDLAPEHVVDQGWAETGQHASSVDKLWYRHLVARDLFDELVSLQFVNMNEIPPSLVGYDFCWSICSLEHLGSIAKGLDFIENSLDVLRPGGIAIHTTEYNIDNDGPTIDNWKTVLFQRRHIETIAERLTKKGHYIAPLDFDFGDGPLDNFIDLPPYEWDLLLRQGSLAGKQEHPAHLKLSIDGFACTCFGLIIRKKS